MKTGDGGHPGVRYDWARAAALAAAALGFQAGCGREFYREWANQDVSEAVFEKSRDPRWRLDMFSIEPPALSRFSDPYDPDRPPAPPDDYAAEQLSPVPQWPDNRLLIPPEGTGYLDMLAAWQRQREAAGPPGPAGGPAAAPPAPPAAGTASPFAGTVSGDPPAPEVNPGTGGPPMSPIPVPGARPAAPPARPPQTDTPGPGTGAGSGPEAPGPQARTHSRDSGVTLAAFQQTGLPLPVAPATAARPGPAAPQAAPPRRDAAAVLAAFQQTGLPLPAPTPAPPGTPPVVPPGPSRDVRTPPIGMDPDSPGAQNDLSKPVTPPPGQTPDEFRAAEAMASDLAGASELAGNLVPGAINFNEAEAGGQPQNSRPYVLTMEQAFTLALVNSRIYQFQLEQLYIASLGVALQRFAFTPQFYAGLSPVTGVPYPSGAIPSPNPLNQFIYATRETGQEVSALNLGTVAGFGKLFNSGARVLAGFANQVVFNFVGRNSVQPAVKSYLPLTLVQPFLRGGGRAVTLEALTQAERSLLYTIRGFAKFRQEFVVQTLIGGTIQNFGSAVVSVGFSGVQSNDPNIGFVNVVEDVQLVENARRNIAAYEQILKVYTELVKGESSGISQLQVDQIDQQLQGARQNFIVTRTQYRYDLDQYKMQMGMPPDTPLVPDRSLVRVFKETFDAVDAWQRDPRRRLEDLPKFAERLPKLEDIVLDGRSVLGVYTEGRADANEDALEDLLLAGERLAMEHRLDLMNQRATLYDTWRQIKVTANALQGVFNVTLTNQFITPPNTTNPFAFLEQSKQFSLVLNAELPLVRLAERNNFRQALINYQRQRRSLQNTEDSIKLIVRQDIRNTQQAYLTYEIAKRNFVLAIRLKDQAFEQIIAPPAAGTGSQAPLQTTNLIQFQQSLLNVENLLVSTWYQFQVQRLQLYRDLGTLPFDEWEAFNELFPSQYTRGAGAAAAGAGPAGPPAAGVPAAAGAR